MNLRDQFFMHGHLYSSWEVSLELSYYYYYYHFYYYCENIIIVILIFLNFSYCANIYQYINIQFYYFYYNYSEVYCWAVWKYKFTALEPWFSNFSTIIYWFILTIFTNQQLKKGIESLPQTKIFLSLYLHNLMLWTFDIWDLSSLI